MYQISTTYRQMLADTVTPVSVYLRIRDHFANPIMLESSDYHGNENPLSYICFDPLAEFIVENGQANMLFPDGRVLSQPLEDRFTLAPLLQEFLDQFETEELPFKFGYKGLFGYQSYDVVRHYEKVEIGSYEDGGRRIPDMRYQLFRYMIVINHFHNELYIFEHSLDDSPSRLDHIQMLISSQMLFRYPFGLTGTEQTNLTDDAFLEMIGQGIAHCKRGDVFQIVLSRRFEQAFQGDEFNVYRSLRAVNPSPYLFYCDYGSYKLMGSSPEAQLIIGEGKATIHPIAGTFRRTGRDDDDAKLARQLAEDPKENSEHVMLVDLARNDLSRHGQEVQVETYKEVQYYSHVIHLVSKVTAAIADEVSSLQLVGDTFPAGTLSGAPKHMAMSLIERYEQDNRGFYGGCIGYLGFDGSFNHAIMIRSLLSRQNVLYYQAGAGIVAKSDTASELQEVHNKVDALRLAIAKAAQPNPQQLAN